MGSTLLGIFRLSSYIALTLSLLPVQYMAVRAGLRLRKVLPRRYHRWCCTLLGLDVVSTGQPSAAVPTLFVCNHTSYLDISVLGSLVEASFIAKREVSSWPLFGTLARLQNTVFVDRRARNARQDGQSLQARLAAGDSMILFPEGTSSDGNRTLPFKSALFAVAQAQTGGSTVTVQPVSVLATALDGIPLARAERDLYAWYGDMDLASHIWSMIGVGRITVEVRFHEPVTMDAFGSRKALADHCWRTVADGVSRAAAGRRETPASSAALPPRGSVASA